MKTGFYHFFLCCSLLMLTGLLAGPVWGQSADDTALSFMSKNAGTAVQFTPAPGIAAGMCAPTGTVNGTLSTSDASMPNRLNRDGIASTCGGKAFPGTFPGTNYYDTFGPYAVNPGSCVTVNFDVGTCDLYAHAMAYLNSFNPLNLSTNYLGDVGTSQTQPFSFSVPGGQSFLVVVQSNYGDTNLACDYSFTIEDAPCTFVDLSLTKDIAFGTGNTGIYHIEVANDGTDAATGVVVTDYLPAALTVTGWSASQGVFGPDTGEWTIGTVPAGESISLWIEVTFDADGVYVNRAEVTAANEDDTDSTPGDGTGDDYDYAEVFVFEGRPGLPDFVPEQGPGGIIDRGRRFTSDLSLTKEADVSEAEAGDQITYTITVTNAGPQSNAGIKAVDNLPECLTLDTATASQGTFMDGTWDIGKLRVGDSVTLTLVTTVGDDCPETVTNTAEITESNLPDPDDFFTAFGNPPENDEAGSAVVTITEPSGRTTVLLNAAYPNPFNPETVITYEIQEATEVHLAVYDVLGRLVQTLVDEVAAEGMYETRFNGADLPSGLYLVRLEAAGQVQTQRITLTK